MPEPEVFARRVFSFWDNRLEELPWSGLLKRVSCGYEPRARTVPVACDAGYMSQFSNKYPPKSQPGGFWCHLNNDPQNWCWIPYPAIIALEDKPKNLNECFKLILERWITKGVMCGFQRPKLKLLVIGLVPYHNNCQFWDEGINILKIPMPKTLLLVRILA